MTDYIIIALLVILALDTDIFKGILRSLAEVVKAARHLILRPFVRFAHWKHIRNIEKANRQKG